VLGTSCWWRQLSQSPALGRAIGMCKYRKPMKVFLAGATGAIGRRLVPMLVQSGHQVTGMTRSEDKLDLLRSAGAHGVVCDVFDAEAVGSVVSEAAPDVVVHELTDLPKDIDPRKMAKQAAGNDQLRVEGTRNLVAAALYAGSRRIVAQSIAFAYAPTGPLVKDESEPLYDDAPWPWSRSIEALHELERAVTETESIDGLVLRYGFFYGPGTSYASDGYYAAEARKRRLPVVGKGTGMFSFIHVDDAASATVAAVERGSPGLYNVVDDDPAPMSEWVPRYAEAVGARKPLRVPRMIARFVAGAYTTQLATELRGASNESAKRELGWTPRYSSWREGFREALG
jgi:nucleoside-diphosphate-sugar epimerase